MPTRPVSIVPRFFAALSLTPGSVGASTVAEQTFTCTGLRTDMVVLVSGPSATGTAQMVGARCSEADILQISYVNPAGANTPQAGTYNVVGL